jgi:uncharacterized membrane protein YjgN (DUF898 family)
MERPNQKPFLGYAHHRLGEPPQGPPDEVEQQAWGLLFLLSLFFGFLINCVGGCCVIAGLSEAMRRSPNSPENPWPAAGLCIALALPLGWWICKSFRFRRSRPVRIGFAISAETVILLWGVAAIWALCGIL